MNLPSPQPAMTKPKERLWENQTRTKERQKLNDKNGLSLSLTPSLHIIYIISFLKVESRSYSDAKVYRI